MRRPVHPWAVLLLSAPLTFVGCEPAAQPPGEDAGPSAEDLARLGDPDSILVWSHEQKVAGFRNTAYLNPTAPIAAGGDPYPLPPRATDLSSVRYTVGADTYGLTDFVEANRVAGLLVLQDGQILHEQYALGNDEETRWISFSIAKSVSSLLMGAAILDGAIETLDEEIDTYMPVFEGTSYDDVSIRDVLQMASGVTWNEDYADPSSDISRSIDQTLDETYAYMGTLPRVASPGDVFNYNTAETHVVGGVIRAATGRGLADYLSEKIWRPFGMEHDATWMLVDEGGPEYAGCCISATLRDYGRLGMFVLDNGVLPDGTRVIPESWIDESTTPSEGDPGYGYLWWLRGGDDFAAIGIFGQMIHLEPEHRIVIVTHSAWPDATGNPWTAHRQAFAEAVIRALQPR